MVTGVVPEDHGFPPPVLVLTVENCHQVLEVHADDLGVRVGLEQAEVLFSTAVDGSDQSDPGPYALKRERVADTLNLPLPPPKVGFPQPGFVDVDQPRLRTYQLQKFHGALLPQDQVLLRVSMNGLAHDLLVAHVEFFPHQQSNSLYGHAVAGLLLEQMLYLCT